MINRKLILLGQVFSSQGFVSAFIANVLVTPLICRGIYVSANFGRDLSSNVSKYIMRKYLMNGSG